MKPDIDAIIDEVVTEVLNRVTRQGTICPDCDWCLSCPECRTQIVEEILANGANRIAAGCNLGPVRSDLAKTIDHTLLKPDATGEQIIELCREAREFGFASVCVNPCWIRTCRDELRQTQILICTVVGFPLGATTTETKAFETGKAVEDGADEIDMVINIGRLKAKDHDYVKKDIQAVVEAAGRQAQVKVILENCYLDDEEKSEFYNEIMDCAMKCYAKRDWTDFTDLIKDWMATAEAVQNDEMLKVIKRRTPVTCPQVGTHL